MPPVRPPIEPMLAKLADELPPGDGYLFEPKWDGFRAIVFRSSASPVRASSPSPARERGLGGEVDDDLYIQSRDLKPLDRYFPELHEALLKLLPEGCVVDGEIVIPTERGLDFELLQMRLHPAASRVAKLSKEIPASFVAFDLLAADGESLMEEPQAKRRDILEKLLKKARPPLYLTPMTRDRDTAAEWLKVFEGAGLDGVVAKPEKSAYLPGKRQMIKVKHARTAECVVAGFRWYKTDPKVVGSLLLGLYDDAGVLQHVGVTSSFSMAERKKLAAELEPLRKNALKDHPWGEWGGAGEGEGKRMPGGQSRWSAGKDLSWEPLQIKRVCEVKYDHLQGSRFRHATTFLRWRPDKSPEDCRYDQLEVTPAYALEKVFSIT
jgi:ATP-dependent DNA ligase